MSEQDTTQIQKTRPKPVQIQSGNKGISLRNTDEMWQWALYVNQAGITPDTLDSPAKIIVAIQYGLEIGLTPMVALNSIAVIGGKPSIYGDAGLAMVYKSGMMEYIEETVEGEGDSMVATCTVKRQGQPNPVVRVFDVAKAKTAQLWGKKGTWSSHPDRMLKYKARAFALRDTFPDILEGLHLYEELVGEVEEHLPAPTCDTPKRADRKPVEASVVEEAPDTPQGEIVDPETPTDVSEAPEEAVEPACEQTRDMMYSGVVNTFNDLINEANPRLSFNRMGRLFQSFASFVLMIDAKELPATNTWTVDMLQKLNTALADGLPAAIAEMIIRLNITLLLSELSILFILPFVSVFF